MDGFNEKQIARLQADRDRGPGDPQHEIRDTNLRRLVADLVQGDDVLDVGCGDGALLKALLDRGKQAYGLESNRQLVRRAEEKHPQATIYHGMADKVARLGRRFDCITSIDVLDRTKDDIAQLYDLRQALVSGGRLIVLVSACPMLYGKRDVNDGRYRRYSRGELLEKLHCCGFEVPACRYWDAGGVLPYWLRTRILKRQHPSAPPNTPAAESGSGRIMRAVLNRWFAKFENRFDFGFGLSLLATAVRPANETKQPRPSKAA